MKNTNGSTQFYPESAGRFAGARRVVASAAFLLCGLAISTSAQEAKYQVAAEQGFTIVPNVQTAIVLKAMPDAACDLHAEKAGETAHNLRFYANGDGYVKIHATAKQESEDGIHAQLDCQAKGKAMRYPLHLRASSFASADMPAPQTVMPAAKGSKVMPALSAQEAEQLTDQELISRGFPPRPDVSSSPESYAKWRDLVSQPITMVAPHLVSRTDIVRSPMRHGKAQQEREQNGVMTSANWSGFVDLGSYRNYTAAYGQWNIPNVVACESNVTTYSSLWVGLDGYETSDLVQDGTDQDCADYWGIFNFYSYSAWEQLLPNQQYGQNVSLSPNGGDSFWALAWVGDSNHDYNPNGGYAWFNMWDLTQRQGVLLGLALNGTYFYGYNAEWIMERPYLSTGHYAELSDFGLAQISSPEVLNSSFNWYYYNAYNTEDVLLANEYQNGNDNNLLSEPSAYPPPSIYFFWFNYH